MDEWLKKDTSLMGILKKQSSLSSRNASFLFKVQVRNLYKNGNLRKHIFLGFNFGRRLCKMKDTFCTETKRSKRRNKNEDIIGDGKNSNPDYVHIDLALKTVKKTVHRFLIKLSSAEYLLYENFNYKIKRRGCPFLLRSSKALKMSHFDIILCLLQERAQSRVNTCVGHN